MGRLVDVARTADIPAGTGRLVELEGRKIALFNVDGRFFALDNTCTHRGGPLSEGEVEEHRVTCPWHGAQYDIETGNVLRPPAPRGVTAYRVVVEGDAVKLEL